MATGPFGDPLDDALPLAGIRVLDISSFIAAPAAAAALGDWGADVIKIEPPGAGDPHRVSYTGAAYPKTHINTTWQLDGRNKRSIALDLKNPEARPVLEKLIARADVLITNFPTPVRERLRLRWEDVRPLNPRLIYSSLTGYGETGPEIATPGFDVTAFFSRSGILDACRREGQPPGVVLPAQGDRPTAMTIVATIMMGLYRRQLTGKGGWVGTSLYANGTWSAATVTAAALVGAQVEQRPARDRPRNALTNQYVSKDGRWFSLVINRERRWPDFCRAIGKPEFLDDPRFQETTRRANAAAMTQELDALFATQDWAYWRDLFVSIGVAAGPINRVADVLVDEQAEHAGLFVPTHNPQVPRTVANPLRFGFAVQPRAACAPELGEHSDEILRESGFSGAEIRALRKGGAVG
jgi:formyl-CoA transferase